MNVLENQSSLKDLFEKYLQRKCSSKELDLLIRHFQVEGNESALEELILAELAKKRMFPADSVVNVVGKRVRVNLISKIRGDAKINNTGLPTETFSQLNSNNLKGNKFRTLIASKWLKIAALWLVIGSATLFLFYGHFTDTYNAQLKTSSIEVATQKGQRRLVRLFDGTKIWLSPSSTLKYQDQLVNNLREVTLDGEAFFEVAKDKMHPFIIHSGRMQTKVVGTSFNIKSYSKLNLYSVTVVTGVVKVAVMSDQSEKLSEVTLRPKQKVDFNNQKLSLVSKVVSDLRPVIKNRDGILTYDGTPVTEVITDLQRYYNIPIKLENKSATCLCYGEFDTKRPINIVLSQLAAAIGGNVIASDKEFKITGGCDE